MNIVAAGRTRAGEKQPHNEDYFVVDAEQSLHIVCDGMGGHAAGEVAAELAAEAVRRYVSEHREAVEAFDESAGARDAFLHLADEAIQYACREVCRAARTREGCAGMGTSLTMVLLAGDFGVMGHVGGSRLYLHRAGRTDQLSEDHTYAAEVARRGVMTAEELDAGPYARVVTRAVGVQYGVRVDTLLFDILPGDVLLLCTGGVHHFADSPPPLEGLVGPEEAEGVPDRILAEAARTAPEKDGTAIVLHAVSGTGEAERDRDRASEVNLRIETLRRIVIFRHLDMREVCKVLHIVRVERIEANQAVIREGEASGGLYAILSGTLRVERAAQLVRRISVGDHFGEMALFNNRPRSASVVAQTPCELLVIDLARFNDLLATEAALSVKLLWCFAQVLSLRLDDVTGTLYDDEGAANYAEELKTAPFKLGR